MLVKLLEVHRIQWHALALILIARKDTHATTMTVFAWSLSKCALCARAWLHGTCAVTAASVGANAHPFAPIAVREFRVIGILILAKVCAVSERFRPQLVIGAAKRPSGR